MWFFPGVTYRCELDHKEGWAPKNSCFWTVMLEKAPGSPLDYKEIKPVNAKGNQSWIFIGRTDSEAPVLWLQNQSFQWIFLMRGANLLEKTLMLAKKKGMTEDEMLGWYHQLNGHEFEQTLQVGEGQGSLACCKQLDMTEWLDNKGDSQVAQL